MREALRALWRSPRTTAFAILGLALGIGLNGALFSLVYAAFLRPLPFPDSRQLCLLSESNAVSGMHDFGVRPAILLDWKRETKTFRTLEALTLWQPTVSTGDSTARVSGARVTPGLLSTLGARIELGRAFVDSDRDDEVVLLGHALWVTRFGADPGVIGRTINVNGGARTIIGVVAPEFAFPYPFYLDAPAALWGLEQIARPGEKVSRRGFSLIVVGRLEAGASIEQARAEFKTLAERLEASYPESNKNWRVDILPLRSRLTKPLQKPAAILTAASVLLFLLSCANVGCLVLVKGLARSGETAVRLALGASRWHLLRHALAESGMVSALGLALGVPLAEWLIMLGRHYLFDRSEYASLQFARLNWPVLLCMCGLALLTTVLTAVFPAWQMSRVRSSSCIGGALAQYGRGTPALAQQRALVVFQIAITVSLLSVAGALGTAVAELQRPKLAYDAERMYAVPVEVPIPQYLDLDRRRQFFVQLQDRLARLPYAKGAGGVSSLLPNPSMAVEVAPSLQTGAPPCPANARTVTPGYFGEVNAQLRSGRLFTPREEYGETSSVVINDLLARTCWAGRDPIGQALTMSPPVVHGQVVIVGVVKSEHSIGGVGQQEPELYFPHFDFPNTRMVMLLSARPQWHNPSALAGAIKEMEPLVQLGEVETVAQIIRRTLAQPRNEALLISLFALVAASLAGIGVYGIVSFGVLLRRRDLAIRVALGASSGRLIKGVLVDCLVLASIGAAVGIAVAAALGEVVSAQLPGVRLEWGWASGAAALFSVAVCVGAGYASARTIGGIEPASELR